MIVYRELSSLSAALGYTPSALYRVSNRITAHYKTIRISKRSGGFRELQVPDRLLKSMQRQINDKLLCFEPVSPFATAYRPGACTRHNASPHVGKPLILKLDISRFFDHAFYPLVKERAFPSTRYSECNRVLLSLLCTLRDCLPQGAPTSPAISNLILYDFDMTVGAWCSKRSITYTRYCDDMTFSGDFQPGEVIELVKKELKKSGFFLNHGKTVVIRADRRQLVTGLVVNESLHVPRGYIRTLRQELYYCRRFGLHSHMERKQVTVPPESYARQLLGRVDYALSIEPNRQDLREMHQWLCDELRSMRKEPSV